MTFQYNNSLIQRGNFTVWVDEATMRSWSCLKMDDTSFQIVSCELTDLKGGGDAQVAVDLIKDLEHVPKRALNAMAALGMPKTASRCLN